MRTRKGRRIAIASVGGVGALGTTVTGTRRTYGVHNSLVNESLSP